MALITRGNNMRLLRGGRVQALIMPGRPRDSLFSPADLFADGEQGAWYDPSDFSTMFQDKAGTTPVTAVGQPVGLILDKSKGLVLGPELITNGTFNTDLTGWTLSGTILPTWSAAGIVLTSDGNFFSRARQAFTTVSGRFYTLTFNVVTPSSSLNVHIGTSAGASDVLISGNLMTASTKSFVFVAQGTTTHIQLVNGSNSIPYPVIDNISVRELAGNHASQPTTTSRPILRQDAGLKYYLDFDGTDDWLQTSNIDFSTTDKISVFAGVRKLSDAALGVVTELSATIASNNGTFLLSAPNSDAANYNFSSKGTSQVDNTVTTYVSPITNVVTGLADIAAPTNIIRINQVATELNTSQGTGKFGNYPLYIGRRGGTSPPFAGRIYSLIIRGALTNSPQLEQTEQWIAAKTGVTL